MVCTLKSRIKAGTGPGLRSGLYTTIPDEGRDSPRMEAGTGPSVLQAGGSDPGMEPSSIPSL